MNDAKWQKYGKPLIQIKRNVVHMPKHNTIAAVKGVEVKLTYS
jgi:hypothetical protein